MNYQQFKIISARILRTENAQQAVKLVIFDEMSPAAAELMVYGAATNTVSRAVNRVRDEYKYHCSLLEDGGMDAMMAIDDRIKLGRVRYNVEQTIDALNQIEFGD